MMEICQLQKGDRSEVEMKRWSRQAIGRGGPTKTMANTRKAGEKPNNLQGAFFLRILL